MKKKTRLLRTLLATAFSLCACAGVPEKPDVEICSIDIGSNIGRCARTKQVQTVEDAEYHALLRRTEMTAVRHIPLSQMDKFLAFSPDDWAKVAIYMKVLREHAEQSCKGPTQ
jgi:hypothetical protein